MHTPSELLQVKGFDVEDYAKLAPLVSTLPQHTSINVNTAKAEVLMAVAENMSHSEAQAIVEELQEEGYDSVGAFQQRLQGYNFPADGLSVASDYFLASSTTWFGRSNVQLYSLLERNQDGDVKVVMRAQGTY
jgi:general secretion pathway protein K